ncbi:MAG: 4'-phosphopantetheinyl transferase superfamily protein [Paludibacteraceae bacterium]|nr:4'-phosphopantetheinyl transferase superfamily protein [Paludibacteraceae bacterium]
MLEICVDDDMSRMTAEEVARLLPLVSAQRREEALRYKHVSGQYCCLRSWEMLRHQLIDNMQLSQSEADERMQEWQYNEHGKPHLKNGPYFSISHCKEAIAVAISDKPVGIDIEFIRPAKKELMERVMSEEEKRKVECLESKEERDRLFTRLWTQKEAIVKYVGTGILSFEQLQGVLDEWARGRMGNGKVVSVEKERYIYSIATEE